MKHTLIDIQVPTHTDPYKYEAWVDSTGRLERLKNQGTKIEKLATNILLIQLSDALDELPQVFQALVGVSYRYRLFDGETEWHQAPMTPEVQTPKTI